MAMQRDLGFRRRGFQAAEPEWPDVYVLWCAKHMLELPDLISIPNLRRGRTPSQH